MHREPTPLPEEDLETLRERAKELRCLYAIHDVLADRRLDPVRLFECVLEIVPSGWQRPDATGARIVYLGHAYTGPGYAESGARLTEVLRLGGVEVGRVEVSNSGAGEDPFLAEERVLLRAIARRMTEFLEWKHAELLGGGRGGNQAARLEHWRWRQNYVEALVDRLDLDRFGVTGLYLGGSTARGDAGPGSDVDLYVRCVGTADERAALAAWLEGWSLCLGELALQQTGYRFAGGLLSVTWLEAEPTDAQRFEWRDLRAAASRRARTRSQK